MAPREGAQGVLQDGDRQPSRALSRGLTAEPPEELLRQRRFGLSWLSLLADGIGMVVGDHLVFLRGTG